MASQNYGEENALPLLKEGLTPSHHVQSVRKFLSIGGGQ
jgi:hypothetical protein